MQQCKVAVRHILSDHWMIWKWQNEVNMYKEISQLENIAFISRQLFQTKLKPSWPNIQGTHYSDIRQITYHLTLHWFMALFVKKFTDFSLTERK